MRPIDADALQEHIRRCCCEPCEAEKRDYNHVRCRACEAGDTLYWIEDAPTINAIPVVRCKDCRKFAPYSDKFKNEHYDTKDGACMMLTMCVCEWQDAGRYNDDFCSHGGRKEADHD